MATTGKHHARGYIVENIKYMATAWMIPSTQLLRGKYQLRGYSVENTKHRATAVGSIPGKWLQRGKDQARGYSLKSTWKGLCDEI
jgi:hypothetical protein